MALDGRSGGSAARCSSSTPRSEGMESVTSPPVSFAREMAGYRPTRPKGPIQRRPAGTLSVSSWPAPRIGCLLQGQRARQPVRSVRGGTHRQPGTVVTAPHCGVQHGRSRETVTGTGAAHHDRRGRVGSGVHPPPAGRGHRGAVLEQASAGASRANSASQDSWHRPVHDRAAPVLPNISALPSNRSARSIRPLGDFTPAATRGHLLPQAQRPHHPGRRAIAGIGLTARPT